MGDLVEDIRSGYEVDECLGKWDKWVTFPASLIGVIDIFVCVCAIIGLGVTFVIAEMFGVSGLVDATLEWMKSVGMYGMGVLMLCLSFVWIGSLLNGKTKSVEER